MATRIYAVGPKKGSGAQPVESVRLVRASTQAQAVRHVVRNTFTAEVATQEQLVDLMTVGVRVEDAGEETE